MKSKYIFLIFFLFSLFVQQIYAQQELKCNKDREKKVCLDTIVSKTTHVDLEKKSKELQAKLDNLSQDKYNIEVDIFLNQETTQVFTSFRDFPLDSVHPRSRELYNLVKYISDFDKYLKQIENEINKDKISQYAKDNGISIELAKTNLSAIAKEKMRTIDIIFDKIREKRQQFAYLSEVQKKFYDELIDKYNELYNQVNPE